MTDGWALAARARRDFADMVDGLSPEQITASTLCEGWNVQHVAAHLVTFVDVPLPKFMFNVAKNRGNFDKASDQMARTIAQRPISDLVATIRQKADKKAALPIFPGELTAMDTVVHTQDVRRALDLPGGPDPELVQSALEFLTENKRAGMIVKKGTFDGLRFEATDLDWSYGSGETISGTGEALMMAMTGRPVDGELTGDGVAALGSRLEA